MMTAKQAILAEIVLRRKQFREEEDLYKSSPEKQVATGKCISSPCGAFEESP